MEAGAWQIWRRCAGGAAMSCFLLWWELQRAKVNANVKGNGKGALGAALWHRTTRLARAQSLHLPLLEARSEKREGFHSCCSISDLGLIVGGTRMR